MVDGLVRKTDFLLASDRRVYERGWRSGNLYADEFARAVYCAGWADGAISRNKMGGNGGRK